MSVRTITTISRPYSGRTSWRVNRAYGPIGPWVIQRATTDGLGGHSFEAPKAEHRNFPTRKAAEQFKRSLEAN
jgi:hypothetical protein